MFCHAARQLPAYPCTAWTGARQRARPQASGQFSERPEACAEIQRLGNRLAGDETPEGIDTPGERLVAA
jgi:hypothetical protein